MSTSIHPTAIVASGAQIGDGCEIGPYAVVGEHVIMDEKCTIHAHAVLEGHLRLGTECQVYPFACLGMPSQDLKYDGSRSYVTVGARTVVREYVTINAATAAEGVTSVGSDCLLQSYVHIGHECQVGDRVVISTSTGISGHVEVGNDVIISGQVGIVQFVRIGPMAYIGGRSKLTQDVLPYCIADGSPAVIRAVNKIGMQRKGRSKDSIRATTETLKILIRSGQTVEQAIAQVREAHGDVAEVAEMLVFAEASEIGLARPKPRRN